MGTSLTETQEITGVDPNPETAFRRIAGIFRHSTYKLVWRKETTEESDHGTEILETLGTRARYVAGSVQRPPQFSVLTFNSAVQGTPGKEEPGGGLIDERSIILEEWEGVVLLRGKHSFTARLFQEFRDFPAKRAEIDLEEVADEQRELVVPGSRFSWMIGYRVRSGTRSRFSEIYFRRLPPWTKEELEDAARAAVQLREDAGWI